jgi:hypothetical protein
MTQNLTGVTLIVPAGTQVVSQIETDRWLIYGRSLYLGDTQGVAVVARYVGAGLVGAARDVVDADGEGVKAGAIGDDRVASRLFLS